MGEPQSREDPTQIGRYRILRRLGAGAVGLVYAARDPELDRDVAVKLLRPERGGSAQQQERIKAEAQAMAQLSHPNVVTVFDVGSHAGAVFLAMELVDGMSVREWINLDARPWQEVLSLYFRAGRGLAAAHGAGIIHRDFKPANVLVGRDGRPRVVDFGLASVGPVQGRPWTGQGDVLETDPGNARSRELDATSSGTRRQLTSTVDLTSTSPGGSGMDLRETTDVLATGQVIDLTGESIVVSSGNDSTQVTDVTHTGRVAGTPAYMAPELFTGGRADERTDQFAFAVSVYEGLYGVRPFAGDTAMALVENVVQGRMREPPERSRVPGWVHDIVVRALANKPDDRHESVRAMLASLAFIARVMFD